MRRRTGTTLLCLFLWASALGLATASSASGKNTAGKPATRKSAGKTVSGKTSHAGKSAKSQATVKSKKSNSGKSSSKLAKNRTGRTGSAHKNAKTHRRNPSKSANDSLAISPGKSAPAVKEADAVPAPIAAGTEAPAAANAAAAGGQVMPEAAQASAVPAVQAKLKSGEDREAEPAEMVEDDMPEAGASVASPFDPDDIDLTGQDLAAIPCLSVGSPNRGRLINGLMMASEPGIRVRDGGRAFGTPETIAGIRYAVAKVHQEHPGAPDILVGDISYERGGRMRSHRSHQSGRDVDLGYYPKGSGQSTGSFFFSASEKNMDVPRTWKLVESLIEDNKTQYVFIDKSIQKILYKYAKNDLGLSENQLAPLFSVTAKSRSAKIQHVRGHKNHLHVRFNSPIAVMAANSGRFDFSGHRHFDARINGAFGMRMSETQPVPVLGASANQEEAATRQVQRVQWAKVKNGDNLWLVARRNNTTVDNLCRINNISRKAKLRAGQSLRVRIVNETVPVAPDRQARAARNAPAAPALAKTGKHPLPGAENSNFNSAYYVVKGKRLYSITPLFGMRVSDDCSWLLFSDSAK